jgi:hypothetical protein
MRILSYNACCSLLCLPQPHTDEFDVSVWVKSILHNENSHNPSSPPHNPSHPPTPLCAAILPLDDYLFSVMQIVNDLPRLSMASVTQNHFSFSIEIANFLSQLHSSFQLLNFKNDRLRKRFDSIKYDLKRCEEIAYDLRVRNLVASPSSSLLQKESENN